MVQDEAENAKMQAKVNAIRCLLKRLAFCVCCIFQEESQRWMEFNMLLMALDRYALGAPVTGQMTFFEVQQHKDIILEVRALASCMWCGVSH